MAIERGARRIRRPPGAPGVRKAVFIDEPKKPSEIRNFWMVIFGFYILLTETGVRQVLNGFVEPVINTYNCTKTEADTAILMIPMASSLISGPLCSSFYQYAGARICIIIGASFCFFSFMIGPLCKSIYLLMLCTLGIGIGCGLMRNSIIAVQCEYFKKRRDVVMAMISLGPGIGIFVLPRVQRFIMDENDDDWGFAWRCFGCLYVLSAIMGIFIGRKPAEQTSSLSFFDGFKIYKKTDFVLHLLASFFASSVTFIYIANILILMSAEDIENKEDVYSYQGFASIVAKFFIMFIIGLNRVNTAILMIASYTVAQVSLSFGAFCYSLWQFRIQNFFSGVGIGLFQACLAPFLVALVGPSQLAYALGHTNFVNGLAIFSAVWLTGFASKGTSGEDARSAFFMAMWMGGIAITLCVISSIVLMAREKNKRKPSMKQMRHSSELNALTNITSVENS